MYIFTFSCNSGGKQQPCSIMLKHISVTICQAEVGKMEKTSMPSIPFALHSAYLLQ